MKRRPDKIRESRCNGRRLGVYEVQAAIGADGMGAVDLALDTSLNRSVAIMVLSDALLTRPVRILRSMRSRR